MNSDFRVHVANADDTDRMILASVVALLADPGMAAVREAFRAGRMTLAIEDGEPEFRATPTTLQEVLP